MQPGKTDTPDLWQGFWRTCPEGSTLPITRNYSRKGIPEKPGTDGRVHQTGSYIAWRLAGTFFSDRRWKNQDEAAPAPINNPVYRCQFFTQCHILSVVGNCLNPDFQVNQKNTMRYQLSGLVEKPLNPGMLWADPDIRDMIYSERDTGSDCLFRKADSTNSAKNSTIVLGILHFSAHFAFGGWIGAENHR